LVHCVLSRCRKKAAHADKYQGYCRLFLSTIAGAVDMIGWARA
jgi:hypothetical protein